MTLPAFVGTVLLVIQLSQVLLGMMTVQYAAFAAARSAVVWIPASEHQPPSDNQNDTHLVHSRGDVMELNPDTRSLSRKYREIHAAAAQACVAISPARAVNGPRAGGGDVADAVEAFLAFENLTADSRIGRWRTAVSNRWSYAFAHTQVRMVFLGESRLSPTYNPVGHPVIAHSLGDAGWDEAVTLIVRHEVALVPGPGRWLFQNVTWGSSPRNTASNWPGSERIDRVPVVGSATLTLAGLKSNRPVDYSWREE